MRRLLFLLPLLLTACWGDWSTLVFAPEKVIGTGASGSAGTGGECAAAPPVDCAVTFPGDAGPTSICAAAFNCDGCAYALNCNLSGATYACACQSPVDAGVFLTVNPFKCDAADVVRVARDVCGAPPCIPNGAPCAGEADVCCAGLSCSLGSTSSNAHSCQGGE